MWRALFGIGALTGGLSANAALGMVPAEWKLPMLLLCAALYVLSVLILISAAADCFIAKFGHPSPVVFLIFAVGLCICVIGILYWSYLLYFFNMTISFELSHKLVAVGTFLIVASVLFHVVSNFDNVREKAENGTGEHGEQTPPRPTGNGSRSASRIPHRWSE
jgi:large-conductance mechanosensitive channel